LLWGCGRGGFGGLGIAGLCASQWEALARRKSGRLLTRAGLRYIRIHDLRHTFASLVIQQGEALAYVKDQMGHASIKITMDVYGHLVPGGNKAAVDRLDGLEDATIRNLSATNDLSEVLDDP
jgi:integrase